MITATLHLEAGRRRARRLLCHALFPAALLVAASPSVHAQTTPALTTRATQGSHEIDLFMERVLDNRDASWRRRGDFILRETETFTFDASLGIPISGFRHEYEWYVRDDVVVRSPVRFAGVEIDEETRREYEADWLRQERGRRGRRDGRGRSMSRRDTEDNIVITIERSWGGEVSEPLRERIAADANLIGDDQAAITLNTGAILEELGGVEAIGFGAAVAHTRDLFVMLETDRLTATEVGRARLERWFDGGVQRLHWLSWEAATGLRWAELLADLRASGRAMPIKDSLIAATALVHRLIVVTRNRSDFEKAGDEVLDPFA